MNLKHNMLCKENHQVNMKKKAPTKTEVEIKIMEEKKDMIIEIKDVDTVEKMTMKEKEDMTIEEMIIEETRIEEGTMRNVNNANKTKENNQKNNKMTMDSRLLSIGFKYYII